MGADLYIEKVFKPNQKKHKAEFDRLCAKRDTYAPNSAMFKATQKKVTVVYEKMYEKGYFRDSYNCTGILQYIGLSWWAEVGELLDKDRNLKGDNLVKFRNMVQEATLNLPTAEQLKAHFATVDASEENSVEGWHKFLKEKHARLIKFLDDAVKNKSKIYCSI